MKKRMTIILSIALLLSALVLFTDGNHQLGVLTVPSVSAESSDDYNDIVVWTERIFSDEANEKMDERIQAFADEYGIQVRHEFLAATDFMTNLNAAIEADNVPDVSTSALTKILSYYPSNPYEDITELVNEINEENAYFPAVYEGNKLEDKFYFAPMTSSSALVFIRKDKMEEAGITELPETWEELFDLAEKISDPENGFYGLGMGCGPTDEDAENTIRMILWNHGAGLFDEDGNPNANTDEFKKVIETYAELYEKEVIPPSATTWDPSGNNKSYLMDESGIVFNAPTLYNALKNDAPDIFENTIVMPPPKGTESETTLMGFPYGPAIMADSQNKNTAEALIKYLFEKEWYDEYLELVAPVLAPVFESSLDDEFWQSEVNGAAISYAEHASGYYGFPAKTVEGRAVAAKHYFQFPIANLLNSVVTGNSSIDEAVERLEADMTDLSNSIK